MQWAIGAEAEIRGANKSTSLCESPIVNAQVHRRLFSSTMSLGRVDAMGLEWLSRNRALAPAVEPFLEARDYFSMGENAFDEERWEDALYFFRMFAKSADDEGRSFARRFHRVHGRVLQLFLYTQMAHYRGGRPELAEQAAAMYLELSDSGQFAQPAPGGEEAANESEEAAMVRNNLEVFQKASAERRSKLTEEEHEAERAAAAEEKRAHVRFVRTLMDVTTQYSDVQEVSSELMRCGAALEQCGADMEWARAEADNARAEADDAHDEL